MSPSAARRLRFAAVILGVCLLGVVAAGAWLASRVRASLPRLDGDAKLPGAGAAVTIERDALGVPTVRGASRADVARALGWLHAQDRFFQMDLLRRAGAGELAALFGERALPRDRATRLHGFRALAGKVVASLPATQRAVLDAYVAGVNAGLADLGAKPFEYFLLRADPAPWRAEDSALVGYAMMLDLQDSTANHERSLMTLRDVYGADSLDFFAPVTAPGDAALDGTTAPLPSIPGPKVINIRAARTGALPTPGVRRAEALAELSFPFAPRDPDSIPGSNALALAGAHTAGGGGLLANDMHLGHSVPNIWYRASLETGGRRVTGVTLPGAPVVVAGSNGDVAWGVTVANADTADLVVVETVSASKRFYRAPGRDDYVPIEIRKETIEVKGGDSVNVEYEETIWGPVVGRNDRDRPLALRWIAHDPEAANFALLDLETARTTEEAIAVAHRAGVTPVNCVIADRAGEVAWTVAGRLPKRAGYDGRLPVTWTFGDRKWDGHLAPAETPVVRGPASALPGRIWSGNQRQAGGDSLTRLGDGGYAPPARARQLRDGLAPLSRATPADLLKVQLDDRALFLGEWRDILFAALTPDALAGSAQRGELRRLVEKWEGRAEPGSVSYRLVAEFRQALRTRVFTPIFAPCAEATPGFSSRRFNLEPALRALLREKPMHLLESKYARWEDLLLAAADDVVTGIEKSGRPLASASWGERNRLRMRHPLGTAVPMLGRWLDFTAVPLAGDNDMPLAQTSGHGASQRLVVAPGREAEGIFHMPGGQSAHPLSPFFRAGHEAWVRGEATPLLPGTTVHRLTLRP